MFSVVRGLFYATFIFMIPLVAMMAVVLANLLIAMYTPFVMTTEGTGAILVMAVTISASVGVILDSRIHSGRYDE